MAYRVKIKKRISTVLLVIVTIAGSGWGNPAWAAFITSGSSQWSNVGPAGGIYYGAGNVGIGTTDPLSLLHVYSTGVASQRIEAAGWSTLNFGAQANATGTKNYQLTARNNAFYLARTTDDWIGTGSYLMHFNSNGNVGFGGITDAAYKLDVAGNIRSTSGAYFATTAGNVGIGSTSPVAKLGIATTDNSALNVGGRYISGLDLTPVNDDHAVPLAFLRNNYVSIDPVDPGGVGNGTTGQTLRHNGTGWVANSILFNNGANVGVGTSNPGANLHVVGRTSLFGPGAKQYLNIGASGGEYVSIGNNVTYSSGTPGAYTYRDNDAASLIRFGAGASATSPGMMFKVASSGTIGNAITFTDALTILNNGNIGIGVTNPTALLDVRSATSSLAFQDWSGDAAFYLDGADGDRSGADYAIFRAKSTGALDIYAPSLTLSLTGGNVGIGKTNPLYKLDVGGAARINHIYKDFQVLQGASANYLVRTWDGVLVAGSDSGAALTYTVIETNVPQDDYMMGGFTINWFENYFSTNAKTTINIAGYWNQESNGGFRGFEYTGSNPNLTPTIQVARKVSNGKTVFILSHFNSDYPVIVARDLWLGYSAGVDTYADNWTIIQTNDISGYVNNKSVVARVPVGGSGTANYISKWTSGNVQGDSGIFDNGANIGIGTTNPLTKLVVNAGTGNATNVSGGHMAGLNLVPLNPDHAVPLGYLQANYSSSFLWSGSLTGNINSANTGNVGIGTTLPTVKFQVNRDNSIEGLGVRSNSYGNGFVTGIVFNVEPNVLPNGNYWKSAIYHKREDGGSGDYGRGSLNFAVDSNNDAATITTADTKMTILSSGNVGIGTTAPGYKLDINGTANATEYYLNAKPGIITQKKTSGTVNFSTNSVIIADLGGYDDARRHAGIIKVSVANGPSGQSLGSAVYQLVPDFNQSLTTGWILRAMDATYLAAPKNLGHVLKLYSAAYTGSESIYLVYEGNILNTNENGGYNVTVEWTGLQSDKALLMEVINKSSDARVTGAGAARVVTAANRYDDRYLALSGGTMTGTLTFSGVTTDITTGINEHLALMPNGTGNVGINTTSPVAKLGIATTNNLAAYVGGRLIGGLDLSPTQPDHAVPLGYLQANYNSFWGGSPTGSIYNANTGNVGIGTTTPIADLEIKGKLGTNATALKVTSDGNATDKVFHFTGNEAAGYDMVMTQTGNVGIGIINPGEKFHIQNNTNGVNLRLKSYTYLGSSGSGEIPTLGFNAKIDSSSLSDTPVVANTHATAGYSAIQLYGYSSGIKFLTYSGSVTAGNAVNSERMRITGNGSVGIGTAGPGVKLSVYNSTNQPNGAGKPGSVLQLGQFLNSGSGEGPAIDFNLRWSGGYEDTTLSTGWIGARIAGIYDSSVGNGGALTFLTNGGTGASGGANSSQITEKMRIKPDGNVGIGTTSPVTKLAVHGGITGNVIYTGGGQVAGLPAVQTQDDQAISRKYLHDNFYSTSTISSTAFWSGSLTGNINNANTGNVGIGTTNPDIKLHVSGSAKVTNVLRAGNYRHVLSTGSMSTAVNGYLLTTAIPYDGLTNRGMHTIRVQGFAYGNNEPIDFVVNLYLYGAGFSTYNWTNYGAYDPGNVKLSFEGNILKLWWSNVVYYPSFEVFTTSWIGAVDTDSYFEGWTITDAAAPATNVVDVGYANAKPQGLTMGGNISLGANWLSGDGDGEGVFVSNAGGVGVGTGNPGAKLEVYTNGANVLRLNSNSSSNNNTIEFYGGGAYQKIVANANTGYFDIRSGDGGSGHSIRLFTDSNERVKITSGGNVGVATTSPVTKLAVNGGITGNVIYTGGGQVSGLPFTQTEDDQAVSRKYLHDNFTSTSTISSSSFWAGSLAGNIYNANSGNVGIGTSSPTSKLVVSGPSAIVTLNDTDSTSASYFNYNDQGVQKAFTGLVNANAWGGISGSLDGDMFVTTHSANNASGRIVLATKQNILNGITINSGGNVGIQAASAIAKLQIGNNWSAGGSGTIYLGGSGFALSNLLPEQIITTNSTDVVPGRNIGLALHNSTATAGAYAPLLVFSTMETGGSTYNGAISAIGARTVTGSGAGGSYIDGEMMFYTAPTLGSGLLERMRITEAGNIGFGTTNPNRQLTFGQSAADAIQIRRLTTSQGNPAAGTGISWTWNGGSPYDNETWAAIRVIMPGNTNSHMTFSTTPSGGGAAGLTERMRIQDNGNVGINTSTPANKLAVSAGTGNAINAGGGQVMVNLTPLNNDHATSKLYVDSNFAPIGGASKWTDGASGSIYRNSNVGIGVTNPDNPLTIKAGVNLGVTLKNAALTYNLVKMIPAGSSGANLDQGVLQVLDAGVTKIQLWSAGSSYFDGGKVGIGTTNPTEKLTVNGRASFSNNAITEVVLWPNVYDADAERSVRNVIGNMDDLLSFAVDRGYTVTANRAPSSGVLKCMFWPTGSSCQKPGWSAVSVANPVEITISSLPNLSVDRMIIVPAGRNSLPINYKIETYDIYNAGWVTRKDVTGETTPYIKYAGLGSQEGVQQIRITITDAGDADQNDYLAISNIVVTSRYQNGRFTGYSLSAAGDTSYGQTTFTQNTLFPVNGIWNTNGNVGIGITNPSNPLHVVGRIYSTTIVQGDEGAFRLLGTYGRVNNNVELDAYTDRHLLLQTRGNGNVGINTTTPINKLAVSAGTGNAIHAGGGQVSVNLTPLNNDHATSKLYVDSNFAPIGGVSKWADGASGSIYRNSNVGIGITNPSQKLDVVGNVKSTGYGIFPSGVVPSATGAPDGKIFSPSGDYTASSTWGINYNEGSPDYIEFNGASGANAKISLDDGGAQFALGGGNVGIGTALPQEKLHILGDPTNTSQPSSITNSVNDLHTGLFINGSGNAVNEKYGIQFGNYNQYGFAGIYSIMNTVSGATMGDLTFDLKNAVSDATLTERMRITSGGNVGIGTTAPGSLLEIYKSVDSANDPQGIKIVRAASTNYTTSFPVIDFYSAGNPFFTGRISSTFINGSGWANTGLQLWTPNTSGTITPRMTIVNNGNIGMGTTNPQFRLSTAGGDTIGTTILRLATESYLDSAQYGFEIYGFNNGSNGHDLRFRGRTSATGSFSDFVTIKNSGNVGIGTTSPDTKFVVSAGTGNAINAGGGQVMVNLTPVNNDHATSKLYVDSNFAPVGGSSKWATGTGLSIYRDSNVGIGTSNPINLLDIAKTATTTYSVNAFNTGQNLRITFGAGSQSYGLIRFSSNGQMENSFGVVQHTADNQGDFVWQTWDGSAYGERMRITATGNIGIGTTNPNSKFNAIDGTVSEFKFNSGASALTPTIAVGNTGASGKFAGLIAGTSGAGFYYDDSGVFTITAAAKSTYTGNSMGASGAHRLWISSNGNIGFGTTNPRTALDTGVGVLSGAANDYTKAQFTITGGGTVTWNGTKLKWTARFIAIPVSHTSASSGYIDIVQPTVAIPAGQVYDGAARAADSTGVSLNMWEALYAEHTAGGSPSAITYRIVRYTNTFNAPSNWILVAAVNGDDGSVRLANGYVLKSGGSYASGVDNQYVQLQSATPGTQQSGSLNVSGSGLFGGNVGISSTTPGSKLVVAGGGIYVSGVSGDALYTGGGHVGGLSIVPLRGDHAISLAFATSTFFMQGGNSFGATAILGTNDNNHLNIKTNNSVRMTITNGGNVGIGTTDPGTYKLKVVGNVAVTGTLETQTGSDFAEEFRTEEVLEAGTVVVMGDLGYKSAKASLKAYDRTVIGIVSDSPSIIAGRVETKAGEHKAIIAMSGVVSVKATSANGQIRRGDLLVSSNTEGLAMKSDGSKPGTVIGKALEDLSSKQGTIKVLINLQ